MTAGATTAEGRRLALLLRRQIALEKDVLMGVASDLVKGHFVSIERNSNILRDAQLKNLEGVAFSALNRAEVIKFINKQADKDGDQKPDKQKWVFNELHKNLLARMAQIAGRDARKTEGEPGSKDRIVASVKEKASASPSIPESVVNAWFIAEREQEIQMELLREFISHFAVFYTLQASEKRRELGLAGKGEENE